MKQLTTLVFQYYRLILLYNIAFTAVSIFLFAASIGKIDANSLLFAKLTGFGGAVGLYHFSSKNTYLYFMNAGFDIKKIIACAFFVDVIIYLMIITAFYLLKTLLTGRI